MRVIHSRIIPFSGFDAINLFGFIFARTGILISATTLRHEAIHTKQMKELAYLPFYILYLLEWLIKLIIYRKEAYRNISFEREAYFYENNPDQRKHFGWVRFIHRHSFKAKNLRKF